MTSGRAWASASRQAAGKTYLAQYTLAGQKRRVPLGSCLAISLAAAREATRSILGDVAKGEDPAAERKATASEAKRKAAHDALTLAALLEQWEKLRLAEQARAVRIRGRPRVALRVRQAPEGAGGRPGPRRRCSGARQSRQGRKERDGEPHGRIRPGLLPMGRQAGLAAIQPVRQPSARACRQARPRADATRNCAPSGTRLAARARSTPSSAC